MQPSVSHLTWLLPSAAWCPSLPLPFYHLYLSPLLQQHPLLTPTTPTVAATVTTPAATAADALSVVASACAVHKTGPNPPKQCMQAV